MAYSIRMPDAVALSDLIGAIYEGAQTPELWQDILARISTCVAASRAALLAPGSSDFALTRSLNIDPQFWTLYAEHYWQEDLLAGAAISRLKAGQAGVAQEYVPWSDLERSGYYNDFLRPAGIKGVCAAVIADPATPTVNTPVLMTFYREPGVDDFTPSVVNEFLQLLAPHLKRSLQMYFARMALQAQLGVRERALERFSTGVIVFDGEGRMQYCNARGREGARFAGLDVAERALFGPRQSRRGRVMAAVKEARENRVSMLHFSEEGREVHWIVGPLGDQVPGLTRERDQCVVAMISAEPPRTVLDAFAQRYGLTAAETRLLKGLLDVHGEPKRLASQFDVSVDTIRSQLKAIYAKTGTSGQRALLLKIASLPRFDGEHGDDEI